jgi:putative sigma-54 modulation protein
MRITIRSKNFEVADHLREYVERKVTRLERFLADIEDARVDLAVQNTKRAEHRQVAQITLRSGGGVTLRAEERSTDLRAAIDAALEKMSRQIKRYKGKHWQSQSRSQAEMAGAESAEETEAEVVRVKRFETRPMDVEEAIEQMLLLGHDFFAFYNASTDGFSVVYRRHDGGYGLLLPELA